MKKALAWVFVAAVPAALVASCTTNGAVAEGGACFQMIDCQPGLICRYVNEAGTCSKDLSNLGGPPEAGSGDVAQQQDGTVTDAPVDQVTPPQDTGTQDTGNPQDTGTTQDSGGGTDAGNG